MSGWGAGLPLNTRIERFTRKLGDAMEKLLSMGKDPHAKHKLRMQMNDTRTALIELGRDTCRVLATENDRRQLERKRERATERVGKTARAIDDMAQGILLHIQQNGQLQGLKNDSTRVRGQIKDLKLEYAGIEAEIKALKVVEKPVEVKPSVKAINFFPVLYLQQSRTYKFEISGPLGTYAGVVVRHVPGKNYGGHLQAVEEREQKVNDENNKSAAQKASDRKKLFVKDVGAFKVENGGELSINIKRQMLGNSAVGAGEQNPFTTPPLAWSAPKIYQFEQFDLLQGIGFTLAGDNAKARISYTHRDFSGRFRVEVYVHKDRAAMINGIDSNSLVQNKIGEFVFDAVYQPGLVPLSIFSNGHYQEDDPNVYYDGNLAIYQGDPAFTFHATEYSHFGKPELHSKLREVGRLFAERFPGKYVWINDMSLPWGGTFRTGQQLKGGHRGHKSGNEADISFTRLENKEQRFAMDSIVQRVFTSSGNKFHEGPKGWHWHVSISGNYNRKTTIIEDFIDYFNSATPANKDALVDFIKRFGLLKEFVSAQYDSYFKQKREANVIKNIKEMFRLKKE